MNLPVENMDDYLNSYRYHHDIPGFSASILQDGEMVYNRNFGYISLDSKQAVTAETVFSIQSITKGFTALALLHLEENTHFSLEDPIVQYLPYFKTKSGTYDKITTQHILSHTAGFPDNIWVVTLLDKRLYAFGKDLPEYAFLQELYPNVDEVLATLTNREAVTRFFEFVDLAYEPGESWMYCTDAYVIAADVLEKVSGITFEEYVAKYIFEPLQLERTYVNPNLPEQVVDENIASYYMNTIQDKIAVPMPYNKIGAPTGFIYSTAKDISTYALELLHNRETIVGRHQVEKMFAPIAKREGGISYGLGWKVSTNEQTKIVEHAGGYLGVSSHLTLVPDKKLGIILLSNMDQIPLHNVSKKLMNLLK